MNIIRIDPIDFNNGPGLRCVIWCAGCNHHCPECHNKEAQDPTLGRPIGQWVYDAIDKALINPHCAGVTFSGGEATFPDNREDCLALMRYIKENYPNKTIWMWTGYLFEEISSLPMMKYVDVCVDGPYIAAKNTGFNRFRYRGSSNQRVIDVQSSKKEGKIILYVDFDGLTSDQF